MGAPELPEPFSWEVVRNDSTVRIAPAGEIDMATHGELQEAIGEILRSGIDRLILDLRRVSFLDSNGLRLALELHAAASGDGFELELVPGPPPVQRIFEVTGTLDALPFVSTER